VWNIIHLKSKLTQKVAIQCFLQFFSSTTPERMFTAVVTTLDLEKLFSQEIYTSVTATTQSTRMRRQTYSVKNFFLLYNRIISTTFPSFCTTTICASLTHLTSLLTQSHKCSSYISWPILAPSLFWMHENAALYAHEFAQSPELWQQPRFNNVTRAWS
jgi:hypothetical protein